MLHGGGTQPFADFLHHGIAFLTLAGGTDLDQSVTVQATSDFFQYRGSQPCVAYHDHGIERVGARFKGLALCNSKCKHGNSK